MQFEFLSEEKEPVIQDDSSSSDDDIDKDLSWDVSIEKVIENINIDETPMKVEDTP